MTDRGDHEGMLGESRTPRLLTPKSRVKLSFPSFSWSTLAPHAARKSKQTEMERTACGLRACQLTPTPADNDERDVGDGEVNLIQRDDKFYTDDASESVSRDEDLNGSMMMMMKFTNSCSAYPRTA